MKGCQKLASELRDDRFEPPIYVGTGQVSVVQNQSFRCAVSTAPEGLFKSYSTVVLTFDGEWGAHQNQQVVAKAMLRPGMSSGQRAEIHGALLARLDALGSNGTGLANAIDEVFAAAKGKNLIVDSANQAHSLVPDEYSDLSAVEKAVREIAEANERQVAGEADRLMAIINDVAGRTGKAPVGYNDQGEIFVHPDLKRELQKPGNEELIEMLLVGFRASARR